MKFNPDIHKRRSIRLKNYDYTNEGLYFITLSIKDKLCLFGKIESNKINLFESGKMIKKYWLELEQNFDNIKLHDFIIMPNHFHGIIEIKKQITNCGCKTCRGTPCGYPDIGNNIGNDIGNDNNNNNNNQGTHKGCPYNRNVLGNIIGGFKSKTTHNYIQNVYDNKWGVFNKKLWQRDFYENIIRNEKGYLEIQEYINTNVIKWEEDKFYHTEI